jgi:hypothetical protein
MLAVVWLFYSESGPVNRLLVGGKDFRVYVTKADEAFEILKKTV